MNKNIKKILLRHFHLIKKPTMNDFEYISEWLTDAYNNHKELKGYALYHNLNDFIHDAFVEHTIRRDLVGDQGFYEKLRSVNMALTKRKHGTYKARKYI